MPGWEDTKRAAQSAYMSAGNGFQDMYSGIGSAYQQILLTGQLSPSMVYSDIGSPSFRGKIGSLARGK